MVVMNSPDFVSSSEFTLLRALTSRTHRPNLMVVCGEGVTIDVLAELVATCITPLHVCALPGPLRLPDAPGGTLFLNDVADLTLQQQIALFDWIGRHRGAAQIISVTQANLPAMVRDGRFLEGLFYRLNTVRVQAARTQGH
jgi:transcriptional regulator of acetoin/glycerol metabolism